MCDISICDMWNTWPSQSLKKWIKAHGFQTHNYSTSFAKDSKSKRSSALYSFWTHVEHSLRIEETKVGLFISGIIHSSAQLFCASQVCLHQLIDFLKLCRVLWRPNAMMSLPCDFKKTILLRFPYFLPKVSVMIAIDSLWDVQVFEPSNISETSSN